MFEHPLTTMYRMMKQNKVDISVADIQQWLRWCEKDKARAREWWTSNRDTVFHQILSAPPLNPSITQRIHAIFFEE
jgi:hypothetical protein